MNIRPWAFLVAALAALLVLVGATSAPAQRVPGGGRKVAPAPDLRLPALNVDGVVDAVAPTALRIKSDAGQTWVLYLQASTKATLTGTAKPDVLASGGALGCISFVAEVDTRRARVEAKVSKLSIFTPSDKHEVGAVPSQGFGADSPDGAAKTPAGKADPAKPGAAKPDAPKPLRTDAPLFTDDGLGDFGKSKSGRKMAGPALRSLEVSGQITSLKNGKASVHAPNQYFRSPLKIELAEEPEISVELLDAAALRFVRVGDRVTALCGQMTETSAKVNDIKVVMAAPLTGAMPSKKKPAAKSHKTDDDAAAGKKDDAKAAADDKSADKSSDKSPEEKPVRKSKPRPKPKASDDAPAEKDQ